MSSWLRALARLEQQELSTFALSEDSPCQTREKGASEPVLPEQAQPPGFRVQKDTYAFFQ